MRRAALPLFVAPPLAVWLLYVLDAAPFLATVAALVWIFVSIPVAILVALDWFRETAPTRRSQRALRHALRVPILLLGVTACLIGASVVVWVAYNLLWQRQPQFREGSSLSLMVGMIGFGWYLIRTALGVPEELSGLDESVDDDDEFH